MSLTTKVLEFPDIAELLRCEFLDMSIFLDGVTYRLFSDDASGVRSLSANDCTLTYDIPRLQDAGLYLAKQAAAHRAYHDGYRKIVFARYHRLEERLEIECQSERVGRFVPDDLVPVADAIATFSLKAKVLLHGRTFKSVLQDLQAHWLRECYGHAVAFGQAKYGVIFSERVNAVAPEMPAEPRASLDVCQRLSRDIAHLHERSMATAEKLVAHHTRMSERFYPAPADRGP